MKIIAPVRDFNGFRNNVRFVNGVGETDDKWVIDWFIRHGYIVEKSLEKGEISHEKSLEKCDESNEPDFDSMTPNELREWAVQHGLGNKIRNTRNREKLLEIIRG